MITRVQRFTKSVKMELHNAASKIELDGYTISSDYMKITCDEDMDGSFYEMTYYRNGEEIIAVPSFYLYEADGATFTGSRGGEYELNGEELTKC